LALLILYTNTTLRFRLSLRTVLAKFPTFSAPIGPVAQACPVSSKRLHFRPAALFAPNLAIRLAPFLARLSRACLPPLREARGSAFLFGIFRPARSQRACIARADYAENDRAGVSPFPIATPSLRTRVRNLSSFCCRLNTLNRPEIPHEFFSSTQLNRFIWAFMSIPATTRLHSVYATMANSLPARASNIA
jgi:hypothetical protein